MAPRPDKLADRPKPDLAARRDVAAASFEQKPFMRNKLGPARGIALGLLIAAAAWALIGLAVAAWH